MKTYKIIIAIGILLLSALSVVSAAQYGMMGDNGQFTAVNNGGTGGMMGMMNTGGMMNMGMMNTGMMGGAGWGWMSLIWLVYVAVAAFIFGVIFWWTYKLIVKKIKRR